MDLNGGSQHSLGDLQHRIMIRKTIEFLQESAEVTEGPAPEGDAEPTGEELANMLAGDNWDLPALLNRTLITPSCGTGSLSPDLAKQVLQLTHGVSTVLRNKYL